MGRLIKEDYPRLIDAIGSMGEVQAIGKSGGRDLPEANESDIDLFVFCDAVPGLEQRQAKIDALGDAVTRARLSAVAGRHWGVCDFVEIDGAEICLMYFTLAEIEAEIDSVLAGERLEKEDNYFYPTGRCATVLTLHILLDRQGLMAALKEKLSVYPDALAQKLAAHHLEQIDDVEDFERAVSRRDVFFYHFVLDLAIDHYLQALFAINQCFFPSRKRTALYVDGFSVKPANVIETMARVIELGGKPDTLAQSYALWREMCRELRDIARAG